MNEYSVAAAIIGKSKTANSIANVKDRSLSSRNPKEDSRGSSDHEEGVSVDRSAKSNHSLAHLLAIFFG